jgi:hypothetical protein
VANDATESPVQRGNKLNEARGCGRSLVARALRATATFFTSKRGRAVVTDWKKRAGVSRQQIEHWMDPLRIGGAIGAGDLEAILAPDEREYFDAWLAEERAKAGGETVAPATDPRFIALAAARRAGDLATKAQKHMADGRCDAHEWAEIEQECGEAEAEMRTAKRGARAAKELAR